VTLHIKMTMLELEQHTWNLYLINDVELKDNVVLLGLKVLYSDLIYIFFCSRNAQIVFKIVNIRYIIYTPSDKRVWGKGRKGNLCCQITTPGRSIKTQTTPNFRNRKNSEVKKSLLKTFFLRFQIFLEHCIPAIALLESPWFKYSNSTHTGSFYSLSLRPNVVHLRYLSYECCSTKKSRFKISKVYQSYMDYNVWVFFYQNSIPFKNY